MNWYSLTHMPEGAGAAYVLSWGMWGCGLGLAIAYTFFRRKS